MLDMGFEPDNLKKRREELGLTTVFEEKDVLYLGRLR
jgi:hypothetical protein